MKTYVIGSSGFLGSRLSKWYGNLSNVRNAPSYYEDAQSGRWREDVLEDMRQFAPDLVLIPGASQAMGDDAKSINAVISSNCVLPCLVAHQLLEFFPNARLVVFGSSWQYADSDTYRPFNLYAASKQAGQDLLEHYALRGLKILQLIMFDTYAEDDTRRKLLTILRDAGVKEEEIGTTPGEQEIDLVHIDDVCAGVECAVLDLQNWDSSQGVLVQGLGSGRPILVKDLIARVGEQLGKPLNANIGARPYRPGEVMRVYRNYARPSDWIPLRSEFHNLIDPVDGDHK